MTIPSGPICIPLLVAIILAALVYYKLDPERRVWCAPFAYVIAPMLILFGYLAGRIANFDGPLFSIIVFLLSLAAFGVCLWHGRILLAKTELR